MLDSKRCSMPEISRAEVDTAVYAYFAEIGLDVAATREQLREARDRKLTEVRVLLDAAEAEQAAQIIGRSTVSMG
jgi:hypothetical protein